MKLEIRLDQLVKHNSPYAVLEEVKHNFVYHYPYSEFIIIREIFEDYIDLMEGRYPKYKKCDVKFHDIQHTTDALLALSRLIDGYNIKHANKKFSVRKVKLAIIATIFHDIGYLRRIDEDEFTGAKYTLFHVKRSIEIVSDYFKEKKFSTKDLEVVKRIIMATEVDVNLSTIKFADEEEKILGCMVMTSDYLGQMSSRTYLEKLLFLYEEFKHGGIDEYKSELDLFLKTPKFYEFVKEKLNKDFKGVYKYAKIHFQKRYKINKNLYFVAIERQIKYLQENIKNKKDIYFKLHRRNEIGVVLI